MIKPYQASRNGYIVQAALCAWQDEDESFTLIDITFYEDFFTSLLSKVEFICFYV